MSGPAPRAWRSLARYGGRPRAALAVLAALGAACARRAPSAAHPGRDTAAGSPVAIEALAEGATVLPPCRLVIAPRPTAPDLVEKIALGELSRCFLWTSLPLGDDVPFPDMTWAWCGEAAPVEDGVSMIDALDLAGRPSRVPDQDVVFLVTLADLGGARAVGYLSAERLYGPCCPCGPESLRLVILDHDEPRLVTDTIDPGGEGARSTFEVHRFAASVTVISFESSYSDQFCPDVELEPPSDFHHWALYVTNGSGFAKLAERTTNVTDCARTESAEDTEADGAPAESTAADSDAYDAPVFEPPPLDPERLATCTETPWAFSPDSVSFRDVGTWRFDGARFRFTPAARLDLSRAASSWRPRRPAA